MRHFGVNIDEKNLKFLEYLSGLRDEFAINFCLAAGIMFLAAQKCGTNTPILDLLPAYWDKVFVLQATASSETQENRAAFVKRAEEIRARLANGEDIGSILDSYA